ncbi:hypothetical protein AGMMS4952_27740 [Spirochaetia bacterium]|nr:hypothetical protein AGMMS4952_27740 [Spirochaetia bacterium]
MKVVFSILLVFSLISCVKESISKNDSQPIEINKNSILIEEIDFVILKNNEFIKSLFGNCTSIELSENDLDELNIIINNAVKGYNGNEVIENIILSNYKRQYIAIINEKGEKEVYVNCFYNTFAERNDYWKTQFVDVDGGGKGFFQLKVNLTKKIYYEFCINAFL